MVSKDNKEPLLNHYTKRIEQLVREYEQAITQHLNDEYLRSTKWPDRLADKIASFGGSWCFIIIFILFLTSWITLNTIKYLTHFDPAPYILLNLVLSFIASFQAPIIMMSQNRHAAREKHESLIDFSINYKAEEEIDDIQIHLHRIEAQIQEIHELMKDKKEFEPTGNNTSS